MAINKTLVHFKTWNSFISEQGVNGNYSTPSSGSEEIGDSVYGQILGASIVFIKDRQMIWTHGQLYNCSDIDLSSYLTEEDLAEINNSIDDVQTELDRQVNKLMTDSELKFMCIEPVSVTINGETTEYSANRLVDIFLKQEDTLEITTTSDSSISALYAWPGALGTFYPWLEGVNLFDGILFDMNDLAMYEKWNQGHQGQYHVQFAQYKNCIFWSDNAYISEVARRTNYTLYYSSELPLCYSTIPDNTFKAFYYAYNVTCDPNWSNPAYKESFAQATWATQVFSYYGLHSIGMFDTDSTDFNITLPTDCRGLMFYAPNILNAGVFDAINVTNFGAKSGSWRDAFGYCYQLSNLFIKNLKVNLNISWSPINQQSLEFILSNAANTNKITISLSPFTWHRLTDTNKTLASEKNITLELIDTNAGDDNRLAMLTSEGDGTQFLANDGTYKEIEVPTKVSELEDDISIVTLNDSTTIKESVDGTELVPIFDGENKAVNINELVKGGKEVYVLDATRTDYETLFNEVSEAWDANKQIIFYHNPEDFNGIVLNTLLFKWSKSEESINFWTGPVIIPSLQPAKAFLVPFLKVDIYKDGIILNDDTPIEEFNEASDGLGYIKCEMDAQINLTSNGNGTKFLSNDGTYKELVIPEVSTNVFDISSLIGASDGVLSYQLFDSNGNSIEDDTVSQFIEGPCITTTLDKDYSYLSYNGVYGNTILYVTDELSSMFDRLQVYYNNSLIADSFNNNFKIVITDLGYVVGIIYNNTLYLISASAQEILLNGSTSSVVYTNAFKTTSYYGWINEGDVINDDIACAIALKCNFQGETFQSPFILTIESKNYTIVTSEILGTVNGYPAIILNLTNGLSYYNVQLTHNGSSYVVGLIEEENYLTEHQDISHLATQAELNSKQDTLVSGTNIKTINGQSILGSGNIEIATVDLSNYSTTEQVQAMIDASIITALNTEV